MTNDEKVKAIEKILLGFHPIEMTESELKIRCVLTGYSSTEKERTWAKRNTEAIDYPC